VNIEMNDFVGIFCKAGFMSAVTSCYQVHALITSMYTYLPTARLCYF